MKSLSLICFCTILLSTMVLAQSNPVALINNPLVPDAISPGGASFTLTVNGTGFVSSSVVTWNGSALTTNFVNSSQLTATVPAANIATASTASVTVMNPAPGGGMSNVDYFVIRQPFTAVSFGESSVGTGDAADLVITGDLNNDGILDLVTADSPAGAISSLLGNGDGTFRLIGEYPATNFPSTVVAGDFNGDGKLDLAVGEDVVAILLGNGDGTFQAQQDIPVSGLFASAMVAGDFNGDGHLDLAVANGGSGNIFVLLGNGDGTFQNPISYAAGNNVMYGIETGDFNRDGKLDLAVTTQYVVNGNFDSAVAVLLGNGDGTFQSPVEYATALFPYTMVAADFNGDGILDLIAQCFGSGAAGGAVFSVLLGNGDGTFQNHVDHPTVRGAIGIASADLNGDGKLDLVVSDTSSGQAFGEVVETFLGNGDGTFQSGNFFPMGFSSFPATGDFNGDGRIDLVTANGTADVTVALGAASVLSRSSVNFGKVKIGSSATVNVVLSNIGNASFSITRIGLGGQDSSEFKEKNNCGHNVSAGGSCTIQLTFTPQGAVSYTALVKISDSAVSPAQTIYLSGNGSQ